MLGDLPVDEVSRVPVFPFHPCFSCQLMVQVVAAIEILVSEYIDKLVDESFLVVSKLVRAECSQRRV